MLIRLAAKIAPFLLLLSFFLTSVLEFDQKAQATGLRTDRNLSPSDWYFATGMPFKTNENYFPSYLILKLDKFGKPLFLKKIIGSGEEPEPMETVNLDFLLKK